MDWNSAPPESWVTEYRVYIKELTYLWAAILYHAWKIFERKKKLHYRDAQALHAHLYDFWQCWKIFGMIRNPGRDAFLASPAFYPIENAIPHLVAPKKVGGPAKDEMSNLRYRARLLGGAFHVARSILMEVDDRMLEHARIPFVDIPSPPTSSPSLFPEIDEIDALPEPAVPHQGTTEDEEGDEIDDNDDEEKERETDDAQNARKFGGNEGLRKPSEESVSENTNPTVKEMEKGEGKANEQEKGTEYNSTHEKLAVHQGDVGAFLSSLLADVRNRKPGAADTLKEASAQLTSDSLSETEIPMFENSMLETLAWALRVYGRGFEGYDTYRALYQVACRTQL